MLNLVLPSDNDRDNVLNFYREIEANGDECIGMGNYLDYDAWLTGMQNRHTGKNLPEGYVRENSYLCCEGECLVGVFSLKFTLIDYLLNYGGNIGYAVRPHATAGSQRRCSVRGCRLQSNSAFRKFCVYATRITMPPKRSF